jgi:hypothetical protein
VIKSLTERRTRHLSAGWNWNQLEPKLGTECLQVFENTVARDGIEPPTPAFSGLLTDTAKRFGIIANTWATRTYETRVAGLIGMISADFAPSMFPYCSPALAVKEDVDGFALGLAGSEGPC